MANSSLGSPQGDSLSTGYEAGLQEAVKDALRLNMDSQSSALIKIVELTESGHTVADSLNLSRYAAVFDRYGNLDEQRFTVDWLFRVLSAEVTQEASITLANLRCEMYINPTLPKGARYVVLLHEVDGIERGLLHVFPNPGMENATRQFALSQTGNAVDLGPSKFLEGLNGEGNVIAYFISSPTTF